MVTMVTLDELKNQCEIFQEKARIADNVSCHSPDWHKGRASAFYEMVREIAKVLKANGVDMEALDSE